MKRLIFFVVFGVGVFCGNSVSGQIQHGISIIDTFTFTFGPTDSLSKNFYPIGLIKIDTSHTDSSNTYLWQIGNTNKFFFADSGNARGIMTDTVNEYPVNANSWFVMKYFPVGFEIISFRHKYQTSSGHDGGVVEFSVDSGLSWQNIIGGCIGSMLFVDTFYSPNDTLLSGEPAFNGTSSGWITSRFQFSGVLPVKPNGGPSGCPITTGSIVEIRFRFISDSIPDSLDGWIIGNIGIEQDFYGGSVAKVNKAVTLYIYPNPSSDAQFNFPALDEEQKYSIDVMDVMGRCVLRVPYVHMLNLSGYAKGIYFYKVSNGVDYYSGKLVVE